MPHEDFTLGI